MMISKTTVLVEEESLVAFLDRTINLIVPESIQLEVISCNGWTEVFTRYAQLIQAGRKPLTIVPILDADTITHTTPANRAVLDNPNLFRLSYDLEFSYENWMLSEALIQLKCSPYGVDRSPQNFVACERLIQKARVATVQSGGTLLRQIEHYCREEYVRQDRDPTTFVLPSKKAMALCIAEIVRSTGQFPLELAALIHHLERTSRALGLKLKSAPTQANANSLNYALIDSEKLTGKILVSFSGHDYPLLWVIDLEARAVKPFAEGNRKMSRASWSPNGKLIAGQAPMEAFPECRRKSVLIIDENNLEKTWLSTRTPVGAEADPCWFPDGNYVAIRTGEGSTIKVSNDSKQWKELYQAPTAFHCVSSHKRIARTIYRNDHYFLEVSSREAREPFEQVPDTTDVRGAVSWSPTGRYTAFVNQVSDGVGSVCLYDNCKRTTRFLSSHYGWPYFVSFSPDERFVLFSWREKALQPSLRIVDVKTNAVLTLLENALSEPILGCHAWKSNC